MSFQCRISNDNNKKIYLSENRTSCRGLALAICVSSLSLCIHSLIFPFRFCFSFLRSLWLRWSAVFLPLAILFVSFFILFRFSSSSLFLSVPFRFFPMLSGLRLCPLLFSIFFRSGLCSLFIYLFFSIVKSHSISLSLVIASFS